MQPIEIIQRGRNAASSIALANVVKSLTAEERRLLDARYKIAFVGQFKTGKSTLINKTILKDNLLFTDVLEATSIPTEVEYGSQPKLEIYKYEKKSISLDVDGTQVEQELTLGESLDRTIDAPSAEQIREATSAETPEGRANLANTYSHARLLYPAENLRHFTVVDTPGINTTTEAVLTTTYRILPDCDMAVFVCKPSQLSQVDMDFLRSRVFDSGINRCMVVLHFDPRFNDLSKDNLDNIRQQIGGQLANIGRSDIPVSIAEIARVGGLPAGQLGQALSSSPLDDWLDTPATPSTSKVEAPTAEFTRFEENLIAFIEQNVRPARLEKSAIRCRRILESALGQTQMELGLLEKSEDERRALQQQIATTQQQTAAQTDELRESFLLDLKDLQKSHFLKLERDVTTLENRFLAEIDSCGSVSEVQNKIERLKSLMEFEAETLAASTASEIRKEIKEMEARYQMRVESIARSWGDIDIALKISGGLLEKMPGWLITVTDFALTMIASPFPFFVDFFIRIIAEKIPLLKKILPGNIALAGIRALLTRSASKQFQIVRGELADKLKQTYTHAERELSSAWSRQLADQQTMLESVIERSKQPVDDARLKALGNAVTEFKSLIAELPIVRSN